MAWCWIGARARRATARNAPRIGLFGRDRSGVAALEFAFLAFPFFMIVFATLETAVVFMAELTLDSATERVARQVRTGEAQKGGASKAGMTKAEFREAICKEVNFLLDCSKLQIDLRSFGDDYNVPTATPMKNGDLDTSGFGYALPGRQTVTQLRVYYKWPLLLDFMRKSFTTMPDGTFLLAASAAFKTEPF
jgi:Flp pilus assembly protein TadG